MVRSRRVVSLVFAVALTVAPVLSITSGSPSVAVAQVTNAAPSLPDSDGDGVPDAADRCVGRIPGTLQPRGEDCPTELTDIYAGLQFEDENHRQWYERFWFNDCDGLPWFICWRGEHWEETVSSVLSNVEAERRGKVRFALWRLGRLVGHEWARENDVRAIHTREHLLPWYDLLENAEPERVEETIEEIANRARALIEAR